MPGLQVKGSFRVEKAVWRKLKASGADNWIRDNKAKKKIKGKRKKKDKVIMDISLFYLT